MAVTINSFTPNTKAQSAQVNTNFTNVVNGIVDTSYRAFVWGVQGLVATGNAQGMQYIVPENVTVIKLWAKTTSGTCTVRIKKDSTDIHSGFAVSSTVGSTTSFNATTITAGQVLTLDVTAVSSATDVFVTLETQVTSIV